TGMVSEDQIRETLTAEPDPSAAAQRLVDAANRAGGVDNITVLVVDAVDHDEPTAAIPAVTAAEPTDEAPRPTGEPDPAAVQRRSRRRRLWRLIRWGLPIVVVLAVAITVLAWYARDTYYVGTDLGNVA